jgi:uncharacterized membrane protein
MKIRNGTVLVYSMLFFFLLLSQFLHYYYLNYLRLINGTYIGIVLGIVFVLQV